MIDFGNENKDILLDRQKSEHSQIQTLEHRNEKHEREKFMRKLLLGSVKFNPKICAELGIRFSARNFSVVLVRINRKKDISLADFPSVVYAMRNIGEELYGDGAECYGVEAESATMAFVVNHSGSNEFIYSQSADLKRHIVELFGVHTTLSLCTAEDCTPDDCSRLYNNARYAMLYRLSFEPYSIIDYDKTLPVSHMTCEYPVLLEREIFECIHSKKEKLLDKAISSFIKQIEKMSYDTILLHTARLIIAVDGLSLGAAESNKYIHNSVIEDLSALESIDDLAEFVRMRCAEAMNIISSSKPDTKKELIVSNILNYINENYSDPSLSVEVIAANVSRSSNYIRSIFKQSQGISISEYITRKRFDQVCKMLIETNLTARDIGREVGLNSGSYFYTSFKKYTGFTPDNYRKAHRT